RVPVYEGARTNVVGVVNLMDFLCIEGAESVVAALTVADLMRPLPSVRQDMPVDSVLQDLQRKRQAMAAVTDHEGKAVGIVTVKDLAEQVVGGIKGL
ncbi:MAG TPA: CBS domain-containing protein, partial [Candidatus Brocadiia bacterium]|nr:CBS domain-containing protein [Candidatus Brocadiia bacterium]